MKAALVSALQTKQTLAVDQAQIEQPIFLHRHDRRDCSPTGARRVLPSCLPNGPLWERK